ncbi:uncharacterized protein LOC106403514 [Brassica napus]|uniref:uncharacterized protein LOC106403514 n=1 Tax=Brassica napus TaxID=3708 RepID=UPI00207A9B50|nr:uncharacterized protein LOC106403514 [Brassica napus]
MDRDCVDPLVTHLSFSDDQLIFFDGSAESLHGILSVLRDFQQSSGLALNLRKTCLFLDGNNMINSADIASSVGISQGSLPVRYLGLPLLPRKLHRGEYQPLVDKVRARVTSWTSRQLSFAGRLQLIQSVIYSMITFWSSIYPLPKGCFDILENIINPFLWTDASARGAKVAWESVCSPKVCGGLGLRRLQGINTIYGIKMLWKIFSGSDSLWVAWVKKHYLSDNMFWIADFSNVGSWIWRSLMNIRQTARPFITCHVISGRTVSFWHDDWTNAGPLRILTGPLGPQVSGIPPDATVSSVVREDGWSVSRRSRHSILVTLRDVLPVQPPDVHDIEDDYYLWRNEVNEPPSPFSLSRLWTSLYQEPPRVSWYKAVWFGKQIPKHGFILWLVMKDRMCDYSLTVLRTMFARSGLAIPTQIAMVVPWIISIRLDRKLKTIYNLVIQAAVYFIWKERNSRLHNQTSKPAHSVVKDIYLLLRAKLYSLDMEQRALPSAAQRNRRHSTTTTYLFLWFERIQG